MLESSLVYVITRTLPESLIVILSGMILLDIDINIKRLLKNGVLFGIIVAGVRMLPINFGVHTVIGMIWLGLMLFKMSNNDIMKSMLITCVVWIALALGESIYILIAMGVFNVEMGVLTNTKTLQAAIITLPSLIITFGIILIFNKIRLKINKSKLRG